MSDMYKYNAKLEKVVDGDTLDVIIDIGFKLTTNQRIRLAYVNTPEIFSQKPDSEEYRRGMQAKEYVLKRFAENRNEMEIETFKRTGKYGRYIGIIKLADSDLTLNDELLKQGLAKKA